MIPLLLFELTDEMTCQDFIETLQTRRLEEQGFIVPVGDHYLVKGRYCWEQRGQYSVYPYDGLSLME